MHPRWLCCRKTERYRVFEDGKALLDEEIDIVRLLQYFRFMRHFTRHIVGTMPEEERIKFNTLIKKTMFRKVDLERKSVATMAF